MYAKFLIAVVEALTVLVIAVIGKCEKEKKL